MNLFSLILWAVFSSWLYRVEESCWQSLCKSKSTSPDCLPCWARFLHIAQLSVGGLQSFLWDALPCTLTPHSKSSLLSMVQAAYTFSKCWGLSSHHDYGGFAVKDTVLAWVYFCWLSCVLFSLFSGFTGFQCHCQTAGWDWHLWIWRCSSFKCFAFFLKELFLWFQSTMVPTFIYKSGWRETQATSSHSKYLCQFIFPFRIFSSIYKGKFQKIF